jgi:hypothetical protein
VIVGAEDYDVNRQWECLPGVLLFLDRVREKFCKGCVIQEIILHREYVAKINFKNFSCKNSTKFAQFFLSGTGTVSVFQGRLHEVGIGCRNPHKRCDAAFLENREPWVHRVCRKDFLGKIW